MDAVRMEIRARKRGGLGELAFDGTGKLYRVRRAQRGINGVSGGLRCRAGGRDNLWDTRANSEVTIPG